MNGAISLKNIQLGVTKIQTQKLLEKLFKNSIVQNFQRQGCVEFCAPSSDSLFYEISTKNSKIPSSQSILHFLVIGIADPHGRRWMAQIGCRLFQFNHDLSVGTKIILKSSTNLVKKLWEILFQKFDFFSQFLEWIIQIKIKAWQCCFITERHLRGIGQKWQYQRWWGMDWGRSKTPI